MKQVFEPLNITKVSQDAIDKLARENERLKAEIAALRSKNSIMQEQINLLLHKRFGANSEKYRADQSD